MTKGKNRKGMKLLSLLLVMVIMIGAYFWLVNRNKEEDAKQAKEETTSTISLDTIDLDQLQSFHFVNEAADMTLIKDQDVWKSETELERPINQSYVENMLSVIDEVVALRIINENPEDLGENGLLEPSVFVEAIQSDGKTLTLRVGDIAPGGEGYYASINDQSTVYLVVENYSTSIAYSDADMTSVEEAPSITAENIYHIEVLNREGLNLELLYDTENSVDNSGSNLNPWVILKPYEEAYAADSTKVSELLPNYITFDFSTCVDYNCEDLSIYGLEEPMSSIYVEYYEETTETTKEPVVDETTGETVETKTQDEKNIKIYVGTMDDAGLYYVRKEGSHAVYTMNASAIDTMITVDAFDAINPYINLVNIDLVDKIGITIEGTPYTMELKRNVVTNEDGEEETQVTYYYNGATVEETVFKDVYQAMITASFDAELIKKPESNPEPYMTMSYHLLDKDTTITTSYLPYDESFYLVDTGVTRFLADKRKIQDIATKIITFEKEETVTE